MCVPVTLEISLEDMFKITKSVINKKTTQIQSASWNKSYLFCTNCGLKMDFAEIVNITGRDDVKDEATTKTDE
jgi:hypothetical protein